ncbi:MAG: hypothetical protein KatS3mg115_0379 [Candidatus Poribacteria bacterium]|nr:MAG: hypothetical protein KatS3mg115_0379 [Candidatus Poribacteria bacterium]
MVKENISWFWRLVPFWNPFLVLALFLVPVQKGAAMSLLEFYQQRAQRRWTDVPRQVLAFYYPWYGTPEFSGRSVHWGKIDPEAQDIEASTHYPEIGAYDSHDPALVRRHVQQAKGAGVDGFIVSWWGPGDFSDQAMPLLLEAAQEAGEFGITVYWETVPGSGEAQIQKAVSDLLYLLRQYGSHPAFLRVEGRPVIFVYGRVMGQVPMEAWPEILRRVNAEHAGDYLLIADGYREAYAVAFDGVHTYNPVGWVRGKAPDLLRSAARERYSEAVQLARRFGKIACLTVIPGYDDTKIRTPGIAADRQGGETYRVLWEEAIAADPDWVLITTWNEWHEGSEIEPSIEHGDLALRQTAELAAAFKRRTAAAAPAEPAVAPEDRALAERYAGRSVGVLPGFESPVVLWLLQSGFPLRELSWEQIATGELSAQDCPVVLYAGHERFRQTVREPGDVVAGLQAYVRSGGVLAAIGSGPFPFYYDETGEAVVAAPQLGLPVRQGWETPPEGVVLTFQVNTERLRGLPQSAPFPDSGDRRWRPADQALAPEGADYHSLIRLVDSAGENYGDGAALVRYEGGRTLYLWMGLPRVFGPALYRAVFALLAEELGF